MANVRYRTAFDENHNLININDVTKEERHQHTYRCITCGEILLPRLGTERARHFFHGKDTNCDGETYIHNLAKLKLKEKFDKSEHFYVSYDVSYVCSKDCRLRNIWCVKSHEDFQIDLKEFYDTATIEASCNGFIADVLLTSSKDINRKPILLEVCFTHPCEKIKIDSKLKIIEIHLKTESDVYSIINSRTIEESRLIKKKDIIFYSFEREIPKELTSDVYRYIMSKDVPQGYIQKISCTEADKKLRSSSILELNAVNKKNYFGFDLVCAFNWAYKNKDFRRCFMCRNATQYENRLKCRLYRKCGTPTYPQAEEAEHCHSFRIMEYHFAGQDDFYVEEVTKTINTKPEFKVAIAYDIAFNDYELFKSKCDYYLQNKINDSNVVLISGRQSWTESLGGRYAVDRKVQIENHPGNWDSLPTDEAYTQRNEEILSIVDAAIVFTNGRSQLIKNFIEEARKRNIKVAVVQCN